MSYPNEHRLWSHWIPRCLTRAVIVAGVVGLVGTLGCGGLPPQDDQETAGAVVVMVFEAETNAPLAVPATVIAGGVRGVLEPSEEQLVLRQVPIGTGTPPTQPLTVSAEGYVTKTQQVQMNVTTATWVQISLEAADPETTGTVEGTVTQVTDGSPVVNASVRFAAPGDEDGEGEEPAEFVAGYTDSEGRFIVGGIPAGERKLTVDAANYLPFARSITITADADGGNDDLQLELVSGNTTITVTGTVVDVLTRQPIEGAEVTVAGEEAVVTGADGRFAAPEIPVGDQEVAVSADGYEDFTTTINVLPGMGDTTLELFVRASDPPTGPYTLGGTVTLNGAPDNAGATVTAVLLATDATLGEDTTGPSGRYTLFIPPGTYELTVTFEDRTLTREVTVPEGGVVVEDVDFVLTVE